MTYSGVGALQFLGRLPRKQNTLNSADTGNEVMSPEFIDDMTRWLVLRQTLMLNEEENELLMAGDEVPDGAPIATEDNIVPSNFHVEKAMPVPIVIDASPKSQEESNDIEILPEDMQWVGVNGRCNKVADTCYAFWVGGTLGVSLASSSSPLLEDCSAVFIY